MAVLSGVGKLWLYSGVTITNASAAAKRCAVLRRIAFIVFAQRIGLTLEEIGVELAKLPANRMPESADWSKLSRTWSERIDERIEELQRLREGLTACIGCGCLSMEKCRFANPGDRASRRGTGPIYWIEGDGVQK